MIEEIKSAIFTSLSQNVGVTNQLGNPLRLYDAPVKHAAFPFMFWRRIETKPIAQDYSGALEITATLEIVCKNTGQEAAKKAVEAVSLWAQSAKPNAAGVNIALLMNSYSDVFRAIDGRTFLGVVRLKIIAE